MLMLDDFGVLWPVVLLRAAVEVSEGGPLSGHQSGVGLCACVLEG